MIECNTYCNMPDSIHISLHLILLSIQPVPELIVYTPQDRESLLQEVIIHKYTKEI